MGTLKQRKIAIIVIGVLLLLLFLGLGALNAFRLTFLNPSTPGEIMLYTATSFLAFLLFVAALLLLMRNALKLYAEQRSRVLGARLRTRMLWGGILLSLLPICFMFGFSYLLMNRAVERWFSQPAVQLRNESSRVAQDLTRYVAANARSEADELASVMADARSALHSQASVEHVLQSHDITLQGGFVLLYRAGVPSAWHNVYPLVKARLSTWQPQDGAADEDILQANFPPLRTQASGTVESLALAASQRTDGPILSANNQDYIVSSAWLKPDVQIVVAMPLPAGMTAHIGQLDRASQQYWTLFRLRRQIRGTYMLLMLMITGLSLFVVSWLALHLSKQVTKPIEAIADAMSAVAQGHYDHRVETSATEELGDLAQSFNAMAQDLENSRRLVEQSTVHISEANVALEARRRELETMLQTIPNGVVMLDPESRIQVANRAFSEMLDPGGQQTFTGLLLNDALPVDARETLDRVLRRSHRMGSASAELDMKAPGGVLNIAVTAALLESSAEGHRRVDGYVVVLENATELLHAQKQAAWKEVARRVAHEIKNPLTPISLSAEQIRRHITRLRKTLEDQNIESPSVATIHRCSEVISSSVGSMRSLVDQFASLAEFPTARPRPSDLNTIVENTLALFAGRLQNVVVKRSLRAGLPLVMADPEAIKRALSNLIDNAAEAMAASLVREVCVETRVSEQSAQMLEVIVADSGPGVTDEMRERLFLPYFSTKSRGTGLGLTIAAKIMSDHQGSIRAEQNVPQGVRFVLELPMLAGARESEAAIHTTEAIPA